MSSEVETEWFKDGELHEEVIRLRHAIEMHRRRNTSLRPEDLALYRAVRGGPRAERRRAKAEPRNDIETSASAFMRQARERSKR